MDLVVRGERIPRPGETLLADGFATFPGGKGANQAVAAGRLEGAVTFCGCVGEDDFGVSLRNSLMQAGVDVAALATSEGQTTGVASIMVESTGQNCIAIVPAANGEVTAKQVESALEQTQPEYVLVQQEVPDGAVQAAIKAQAKTILNPAPARKQPERFYHGLFCLTPNETEAEVITGQLPESDDEVREVAGKLLEMGVENVVLTLGSKGCYLRSAEQEKWVKAPQVKAVDTTAAGDAFNGALAVFLAEGKDLAETCELAVKYASISVQRPGAQASMPTLSEFQATSG